MDAAARPVLGGRGRRPLKPEALRETTVPQEESFSVQVPLATSTRTEPDPAASASAVGWGAKSMEINPPNARWWAQPGASPDPEEKLTPWQRLDFQATTFQSAIGLTGGPGWGAVHGPPSTLHPAFILSHVDQSTR